MKIKVYPVREGLTIALITVLAIGVNIWWTYERALEALQGEIKEGLQRTVAANAEMLNGPLADQHRAFHPPDKAGNYYVPGEVAATYTKAWERLQTDKDWDAWRDEVKKTPAYAEWTKRMEAVRKATAHVRYVYTCVLIDGNVYFGFDEVPQNDTVNNETGAGEPDGIPDPPPTLLWPYPDAGDGQIEALKKGVPAIEPKPYSDAWGTYYSAYAPFYGSDGKMVGTIGMDLELEGFNKRLEPIKIALKRAAVTGLCLAILSGVAVWFARRLAAQLSREIASHGHSVLSEQQRSAGIFASGLLSMPREEAEQLLAATTPSETNANFNLEAMRLSFLEANAGSEIELDPHLPAVLHGDLGRLLETANAAIRHVPGKLTFKVAGETVQWVKLGIEAGDCSNLGDHTAAADLMSGKLFFAALAQAHARAIGGDGAADEKGIRLIIPFRKEVI